MNHPTVFPGWGKRPMLVTSPFEDFLLKKNFDWQSIVQSESKFKCSSYNVNYRASFLTFQYIAEHLSDRLWSFYWNKINWLAMNTLPQGQNWIIKLGEFDEKYFAK